jgi:hypothetical protein
MIRRLAVLALVALAGCGGSEAVPAGGTQLAVPWVDPDGDPPIVGGLSVNPADGTLLMTTNTGMFTIAPGGSKPRGFTGTLETPDGSGKVSEALVTRFVGPDELIGSGHPAAGESLPSALGFIRSDDAGRTWTSVSELGTADFHALVTSGGTIVGALFGQPQALVSTDDGKTWSTRTTPQPLVGLAVDPHDAARWIASTAQGVFRTTDGGRTWRPQDPTPNVRFAWADDGDLYRIDPGGPVKLSTDGGVRWEDRGSTGGEPQALALDGGGKLYAALIDGTVTVSDDGGRTFTEQVAGG